MPPEKMDSWIHDELRRIRIYHETCMDCLGYRFLSILICLSGRNKRHYSDLGGTRAAPSQCLRGL